MLNLWFKVAKYMVYSGLTIGLEIKGGGCEG